MLTLSDINNIEYEDTDELEYYSSIQRAINSLTAWKLQGSYGRAMMDAINAGRCLLGTSPTTDYWGNRIPSRYEVKEGTKGSREYVQECSGADWTAEMENVNY